MFNLDEYATLLKRVRYQGRQAGYLGQSAITCPYSLELRAAWLEGHTLGTRDRREAFQNGSHHELQVTREFTIQTGTRRGRKPGTP